MVETFLATLPYQTVLLPPLAGVLPRGGLLRGVRPHQLDLFGREPGRVLGLELHADLAALDAGFDALSANEEFAQHEADIFEPSDEEEDGIVPLDAVPQPWPADSEEDGPMTDDEEDEFDSTFDEEVDCSGMPELTEEILAKMFANMMAHGLEA